MITTTSLSWQLHMFPILCDSLNTDATSSCFLRKPPKHGGTGKCNFFFHFLYSLQLSPGNSQEAQVNYSNFIVTTSGFSLMIWESQESLQFILQSSFIFTWLSPCFEDDFCKPARPSRETWSLRNVLEHLSFFTFWVH